MSSDVAPQPADRIDNLPTDELRRYARRLGLHPEEDLHHHELLDLVRDRHQAISSLERDALLDVVIWARRPVRRSASKEDLVTEVTEVQRNKFDKLSQRGLEVLAVVRNVPVRPGEPRQLLERRLRKAGWVDGDDAPLPPAGGGQPHFQSPAGQRRPGIPVPARRRPHRVARHHDRHR